MTATSQVRSVLDVVFHRPEGFRPVSLDLYLPPEPTGTVCLYLHGGGWRVGTRRDAPGPTARWSPSFFEQVAGRGMVVASVDYRLTGEATFPAQLDDVRAALEFLAGHLGEYGVAGTRFVAWGVSAGGHLAALLGLDSAVSPQLAAVACWYPPTDLAVLADDADEAGGAGQRGPGSRESALVGATLEDRPELAVAASPVQLVHAGSPPFLFVHGTADTLVPPRQSHRLADALLAVGGRATVELVDGGVHMFTGLGDDVLVPVVERTVSFLLDPGVD